MMMNSVPLILVVLSAAFAAPLNMYQDYPVVVPQKRAALVLDRLLVALQKALRDGPSNYIEDNEGPRIAPLRIGEDSMNAGAAEEELWLGPDSEDLRVAPLRPHFNDLTGFQRRGQPNVAPGVRGRVLRCYFNAVTCF